MIRSDLLLAILVRGIAGIFLGILLGYGLWVVAWLFFQSMTLGTAGFLLTQALVVGTSAGLGVVAAWWNMESPRNVQLLAVILTLGTATLTTWLAIEILGVETYAALFGASRRMPVMSIGDMLGKMIFFAVLSGNLAAAGFFLYRALRYREV